MRDECPWVLERHAHIRPGLYRSLYERLINYLEKKKCGNDESSKNREYADGVEKQSETFGALALYQQQERVVEKQVSHHCCRKYEQRQNADWNKHGLWRRRESARKPVDEVNDGDDIRRRGKCVVKRVLGHVVIVTTVVAM